MTEPSRAVGRPSGLRRSPVFPRRVWRGQGIRDAAVCQGSGGWFSAAKNGPSVALALGTIVLAVGCTQNPYLLQGQNQTLQQQQVALQQRYQELQSRAATLDQDNQEMETLLAQARQQNKLLEDQLLAMRDQLSSTSSQLSQTRTEKEQTDRQVEALAASTRKRVGASITANSSLRQSLPAVTIPNVEVRTDGDVVRIELPAAQLFQTGTNAIGATGALLLDAVAAEVARAYGQQLIGVEGHTDNAPVRGSLGGGNHELSVQRALAVYQYLTSRRRLAANQLFTVGHGANHPVVSNATTAGQQRNNRVELVIYPEKPPASAR